MLVSSAGHPLCWSLYSIPPHCISNLMILIYTLLASSHADNSEAIVNQHKRLSLGATFHKIDS